MKRRDFVTKTAYATAALSLLGSYGCKKSGKKEALSNQIVKEEALFFKISLAQWSLHRTLFANKMDTLDFAAKSRSFGLEGLEYVNAFFKDKAKDMSYLKEMNLRADSEGQQNVLIMIDGEGELANTNNKERIKAIENHYKWVEAAHFLGCHAIRVNLAGGIDKNEAVKASINSLNILSEFAKGSGINILVENHGGFSSDGKWMTNVFSQVKNKNCGTLPDFGNFCIERNNEGVCVEAYDKYLGTKELLPYAKAVSAKSYDFNEKGEDTNIDYLRMMKMVKASGYTGFVGIEYEGNTFAEDEGIELTRDLLIRVGKQLA
ncbi:sugar phosphate isomerase/epimerase [Flavivirga sp. 57AJ16]|uniref:sugar phosphate isomerase/epimerase family protein n=1 Tax=Flavivirga sp. 57AJ16 TaxID=3025307 RepID=UPI00236739B9|nr:TIM barrel protein [Flavivirga sp. 57AJ16]MDD7884403.1 TIM barrel protein [Flavivirga sp. 57AJ16]